MWKLAANSTPSAPHAMPRSRVSTGMAKEGIVWDALTLSEFLENPGSYVPGNVMPFSGIRNEDQRQALICYLTTL